MKIGNFSIGIVRKDAYGNNRDESDISASDTRIYYKVHSKNHMGKTAEHNSFITDILNGCSAELLERIKEYRYIISIDTTMSNSKYSADIINVIKFKMPDLGIKPLHPKDIGFIKIPARFILIKHDDLQLIKLLFPDVKFLCTDLTEYLQYAHVI